jgi:hypothetical protein
VPIEQWGSQHASFWRSFAAAAQLAAVLLSEYRRAVAAERRYEKLRCADALMLARKDITSSDDIARCVFAEMYSGASQQRFGARSNIHDAHRLSSWHAPR